MNSMGSTWKSLSSNAPCCQPAALRYWRKYPYLREEADTDEGNAEVPGGDAKTSRGAGEETRRARGQARERTKEAAIR